MTQNFLTPVAPHPYPMNAEIENIHRNVNLLGIANVTAISTSTTLTEIHAGLLEGDTNAAPVTTTLPLAKGNLGLTFTFKLMVAGNNWKVQRSGADTIDGATDFTLAVQYDKKTIRSDDSNWIIIG